MYYWYTRMNFLCFSPPFLVFSLWFVVSAHILISPIEFWRGRYDKRFFLLRQYFSLFSLFIFVLPTTVVFFPLLFPLIMYGFTALIKFVMLHICAYFLIQSFLVELKCNLICGAISRVRILKLVSQAICRGFVYYSAFPSYVSWNVKLKLKSIVFFFSVILLILTNVNHWFFSCIYWKSMKNSVIQLKYCYRQLLPWISIKILFEIMEETAIILVFRHKETEEHREIIFYQSENLIK